VNYLIDTHVLLWSLFDPNKLSNTASDIILDVENTIFVSLITFWEISLKYNIGKISLNNVIPDQLPHYAEKSGFEILNLSAQDVSTFYKLPKTSHKDPFDRLIIWQSIKNDLTLISKDTQIKEYLDMGLKSIW
jgi:PIN domain nuclease of toxin-antitoxin system